MNLLLKNKIISLDLIKNNILFLVYSFTFLILLVGVYVYTKTSFFHLLGLYYISLITFYFIATKIHLKFDSFKYSKKLTLHLDKILNLRLITIFVLLFIIVHYFILKEIPIITALMSNDDIAIALIRLNVTENSPTFINYISSFIIKGILPFYIYYSFLKKDKLFFWLLFFIGAFYSFSLLQKSYIIVVFLPLFFSLLLYKKYLSSLFLGLFLCISLYSLVRIANPPSPEEIITTTTETTIVSTDFAFKNTLISSILKRIIITPGEMVSIWFENIPSKHPYLNGCGYSFGAKLLDCNYTDYASILYAEIRPEYAKEGIKGTLTSASFMHDYANFGVLGLIFSGLTIGFILSFLQQLFFHDWKQLIIFNFYPILVLSSSALTTLMLSHSWAITILLYLIFRKKIAELLQKKTI